MARGDDHLATYRAKRDFAKTAEPSGAERARAGHRFVVQKHAATRLHYDFRLELDGVLLSWAVTRGPSANPADKRLAVRTEDHPLGYAGFEGTIPKGQYGGGTVMLWDQGTWEPLPGKDPRKTLDEGHLHFTLHGERMRGEWLLIRLKPRGKERTENWLLRKIDDDHAGGSDDLTGVYLTSVTTGRTMEAIAEGKRGSKSKTKAPSGKEVWPRAGASAEPSGVKISNRQRVIFPEGKLTKGDLADYYEAVSGIMLPSLGRRPVSLVRCPQGPAKKCFFQKHDTGAFGDAVGHVPIVESDGEKAEYLYLDSARGLLTCVQMGTIEFHGWGARVDDVERPDRLVFDLDPDEGLDFSEVIAAAGHVHDLLAEIGLATFPMVTGGKGVHVIAPLTPSAKWPEVKDFAHRFALALAEAEPKRFTAAMAKAKRKGLIFIDYLRNERGATAVMPYSARAREGGPIAVPLSWEELRDLDGPAPWHITDAAQMVERAASRELAQWGRVEQTLPDV